MSIQLILWLGHYPKIRSGYIGDSLIVMLPDLRKQTTHLCFKRSNAVTVCLCEAVISDESIIRDVVIDHLACERKTWTWFVDLAAIIGDSDTKYNYNTWS